MFIKAYGVIIGLAVWAGLAMVKKNLKRWKKDSEWLDEVSVILIMTAVIGARAYHVVDQWAYYRQDLWAIGRVWEGGLGIWGAIGGGLVGLFGYAIWKKRSFLTLADALALGVPFAQAIGRWGNYVNQELVGKETTLPWGIMVSGESKRYHPLFFYESLLSLGLGLVMWYGFKKPQSTGRVVGTYFAGYGLIRLVLEPMRLEKWMVGAWPVAFLIALMSILIGLFLIFRGRKACAA